MPIFFIAFIKSIGIGKNVVDLPSPEDISFIVSRYLRVIAFLFRSSILAASDNFIEISAILNTGNSIKFKFGYKIDQINKEISDIITLI